MGEISVIALVDKLISDAIALRASDIHAEPTPTGLRIRYRIDGMLYDQSPIDNAIMLQVISRIKVLAVINIAEKRIPQDGKFHIIHNNGTIDLRVSTFPSLYGEKIVIRILDRSRIMISLDALGFNGAMLSIIKSLINCASGFFLVSGPTGSGKTTTLYAMLSSVHSAEKNIITLEDPVEYHVDGVTQGQIHPVAGFSFAKGIRAMLRQDPDIVMIGEIRDSETARSAIEAALTGHLVFSTIHTTNAPGVIMRLMDMGIEPFLINAAVTGILAQRLARSICTNCKEIKKIDEKDKQILHKFGKDIKHLYEGRGCEECYGLGYKGRTGIFELLIMSADLRSLIVQYPDFDSITKQALADGMQSLINDGITKVEEGVITLQELMKAIY